MIQTTCQSDAINVPSVARSLRERKRKRTYSDYVSDDSAVEADLDSGSDSEFTRSNPAGPSRAKRFRSDVAKSGTIEEAGTKTGCHRVGDEESFARDGEKLLMRQWLQRQADHGTIPGLYWLDKDKTQIRIPWKHGSRTGWTIDDCRVYRAWATHTGKILCITEPKKWKANFRCALNSLPDVLELPHLCQKKGSDPFKVYQMLPEVPRKSLAKKTKQCKTEKTDDEIIDFLEQKDSVVAIQVKEETPVNDCTENPASDNSFWMLSNNTIYIKKEDPDSEMQYAPSLIPTVVEEFSEQGNNAEAPLLTNLHTVSYSNSETSLQPNTPPSPATSSTSSAAADSSYRSNCYDETYLYECTEYNLFEDLFLFDCKDESVLLSEMDSLLADGKLKTELLMTDTF